jgi:hypothetical protein
MLVEIEVIFNKIWIICYMVEFPKEEVFKVPLLPNNLPKKSRKLKRQYIDIFIYL